MNELFVKRIELRKDEIKDVNIYPFNIKCIRNLDVLSIETAVTFLYGENGVGKSTLLEAIAISLGMNPEGGSQNFHFSTYDDYSELYKYLKIGKFGMLESKFFLRAETFYNVATSIHKEYHRYGEGSDDWKYGGNLHECSHGESFIKIVENRFWDKGLYILDEPEAALSPLRQMTLLYYINRLVQNGSQFIIATHSPILLAYRDGTILDLNNCLEKIDYKDTDVYKTYKDFINNPEGMQKALFNEEIF